jgi:hypothetical protein
LILDSGKPAYVVAGEVGINYNRLLDYADGRIEMTHAHRIKLTRYFNTDPARDGDGEYGSDGKRSAFDGAQFDAFVRGSRVVPGGDAIVTLLVEQWSGCVREAWKLTSASGVVLEVEVFDLLSNHRHPNFSASVEDVRVKPAIAVEIRLRIPGEERDAALTLARLDTPKTCLMRPRQQ